MLWFNLHVQGLLQTGTYICPCYNVCVLLICIKEELLHNTPIYCMNMQHHAVQVINKICKKKKKKLRKWLLKFLIPRLFPTKLEIFSTLRQIWMTNDKMGVLIRIYCMYFTSINQILQVQYMFYWISKKLHSIEAFKWTKYVITKCIMIHLNTLSTTYVISIMIFLKL